MSSKTYNVDAFKLLLTIVNFVEGIKIVIFKNIQTPYDNFIRCMNNLVLKKCIHTENNNCTKQF